jgi:hypothetical protein
MTIRRGLHKDLTGRNVDTPISWAYADEPARLAASSFAPLDVGRFAWQQDDDSLWMLKSISPVAWVEVGGGGGVGGDVTIRKNSGSDVGTRPRLNFIEGSNVTLTIADDVTDDEVDITIAASGGGDFVNPMTTRGDIIIADTSGTALRLGIGSSGQVLTVSDGVPVWATPSGVSMFSEAESLSSESLGITLTESDVEV